MIGRLDYLLRLTVNHLAGSTIGIRRDILTELMQYKLVDQASGMVSPRGQQNRRGVLQPSRGAGLASGGSLGIPHPGATIRGNPDYSGIFAIPRGTPRATAPGFRPRSA